MYISVINRIGGIELRKEAVRISIDNVAPETAFTIEIVSYEQCEMPARERPGPMIIGLELGILGQIVSLSGKQTDYPHWVFNKELPGRLTIEAIEAAIMQALATYSGDLFEGDGQGVLNLSYPE